MARLLLIGGPALKWRDKLLPLASDNITVQACQRPSEGIRQFQQTPPDLLLIVDPVGGDRVQILTRALRDRPLGQLIPIAIHAPRPSDHGEVRQALDLACWFDPAAQPTEVFATIEEILELDEAQAPIEPETSDSDSASYLDGELVLETIAPPPSGENRPSNASQGAPESRQRRARSASSESPVSREELKRLLKAVRHQDYYAVLDVRRGADAQTIRQAFQSRHQRFDPQTIPFELAHTFQDELDEIADALEDAYAVLGDPELRRQYLDAILPR